LPARKHARFLNGHRLQHTHGYFCSTERASLPGAIAPLIIGPPSCQRAVTLIRRRGPTVCSVPWVEILGACFFSQFGFTKAASRICKLGGELLTPWNGKPSLGRPDHGVMSHPISNDANWEISPDLGGPERPKNSPRRICASVNEEFLEWGLGASPRSIRLSH
jgi:hypothetical protein